MRTALLVPSRVHDCLNTLTEAMPNGTHYVCLSTMKSLLKYISCTSTQLHLVDVDDTGGVPMSQVRALLNRYAKSVFVFSAVDSYTLAAANLPEIGKMCAGTGSKGVLLLDRIDLMQVPACAGALSMNWSDNTIMANPKGGAVIIGDAALLKACKWQAPRPAPIASLARTLDLDAYRRDSSKPTAFVNTLQKIMPVVTACEFARAYYPSHVRLTCVILGYVNDMIALSFVGVHCKRQVALPSSVASRGAFHGGNMHPQLRQNTQLVNIKGASSAKATSALVLVIVRGIMTVYPTLQTEAKMWQVPKGASKRNKDKRVRFSSKVSTKYVDRYI